MENKLLDEEKYKKIEKKIALIAIIVLIIGLSIGGMLIYRGVAKPGARKEAELKIILENKKRELEEKGIRYNTFAKYTDGEEYDLKIITNALDPSFEYCAFAEYKNNLTTKDYCTAKNSSGEFATSSFIMFGTFICVATSMISFAIFMISKRRQILAFSAQQVLPVAQEGIEKVAPSIGKAGASIAKEMAPTYGEIAKEISKGIKEGIHSNDNEKK